MQHDSRQWSPTCLLQVFLQTHPIAAPHDRLGTSSTPSSHGPLLGSVEAKTTRSGPLRSLLPCCLPHSHPGLQRLLRSRETPVDISPQRSATSASHPIFLNLSCWPCWPGLGLGKFVNPFWGLALTFFYHLCLLTTAPFSGSLGRVPAVENSRQTKIVLCPAPGARRFTPQSWTVSTITTLLII